MEIEETRLYLEPDTVIEADLGIEENGPVHAFFTAQCARYMDRFVPFREGNLARTVVDEYGVINEENVTADTIIYNQPYAEYVYYSISADGTRDIKNYTKDIHPDAGPIWDEVMWSIYEEQITQEVQEYLEEFGGSIQ